ncbi:MAG: 1-deoxy-D-xylulose-5-phosphate synthase [Acidobacteria bacterium]|nr:1-deoxy-D-xylulose-5-phosphate synthase [Acidobacteriota bacterium]
MPQKSRIMYIEYKGDAIVGPARIGRVTFSKSGKSIDYRGRRFQSLRGRGFKANYRDAETGEEYWISGCKKDGTDALYATTVEIDDDVKEEYWREIRKQPESKDRKSSHRAGKYSK